MIILDTNVISALMKREPDATVVEWLDNQAAESIWTTSVTLFELHYGLALLPPGKRRRELETAFESLLTQDLESRILDFDAPAARAAASLGALRETSGQRIDMRDLQIAGIALSRRAALATRNQKHFVGTGVSLVNPWDEDD